MPDTGRDDRRAPVMLDYGVPDPPFSRLTRAETIRKGFVIGAILWFWLFAIAFNYSVPDLYRLAILPLVLMACAGGTFAVIAAPHWLWGAVALSATTVGMGATCFAGVASKPGAEHHLYLAALAMGCALCGAICGRLLSRWRREPNEIRPR